MQQIPKSKTTVLVTMSAESVTPGYRKEDQAWLSSGRMDISSQ